MWNMEVKNENENTKCSAFHPVTSISKLTVDLMMFIYSFRRGEE